MNASRLTELLGAYADGRLTSDEKAELETLLRNSAEARQQFWNEMALHGFTSEAAKLKWANASARQPQRDFMALLRDWLQPRWGLVWAAGCAAAIVIVGLLLWNHSTAPRQLAQQNPPATNSSIANVASSSIQLLNLRGSVSVLRDGSERTIAEGFAVQDGDEIRLSAQAAATLHYPDATRFVLASGSTTRLRGSDAHVLELLHGELQAQVTKQPAGQQFVLRTPLASVTVHGTAFALNSSQAATRVDVSEGRVQVDHAQQDSSVELLGGEFAVALPGRELVAGIKPAPATETDSVPRDSDLAQRPFAANGPWNTPLRTGAKFAAIESEVLDFVKQGAVLQSVLIDRPIYLAQPSDPEVTVQMRYGSGELANLRLPASALPDSRRLVNCTVIDAASGTAMELIQAGRDNDGVAAMLSYTNDLRGSGMPPQQIGHTWSGMPLLAGVIRAGELNSGIRHALAASVLHTGISRSGAGGQPFVWPARHSPLETKLIAHMSATGNVHFGTLLAIPPDVNLASLGLGDPALELGRALQNYGAYVTHSYGPAPNQGNWQQPQLTLFADAIPENELRALMPQISKLASLLRVVTNNTADSPGGGGNPRH